MTRLLLLLFYDNRKTDSTFLRRGTTNPKYIFAKLANCLTSRSITLRLPSVVKDVRENVIPATSCEPWGYEKKNE